jgi:hypothetical protein
MAAQPAFAHAHLSALGAAPAAERHEQTAPAIKPVDPTSRFAPMMRRLVVLVPDADTDEAQLARQLWSIALQNELPVLLLGLNRDASSEPRARRRLATIASLARDARVHVDTRLEVGTDWIQAVRSVRRHSDLVVCHAEQHVGIRRRPLSQWLTAELHEPICVLAGFYPGLPPDYDHPAARLLAAAIPFLIFLGFTALQVLIHQVTRGGIHNLLLSASVLVEYSLIGIWHHLFN